MAELFLPMELKAQTRREALAAGGHEAKATAAATNRATKRRANRLTKIGLGTSIPTPQHKQRKMDPANHVGSVVGEGAIRQAKLLLVLLMLLLQLLSAAAAAAAAAETAVLATAFTAPSKATLRVRRWGQMVALRL